MSVVTHAANRAPSIIRSLSDVASARLAQDSAGSAAPATSGSARRGGGAGIAVSFSVVTYAANRASSIIRSLSDVASARLAQDSAGSAAPATSG
ncbi:hypothetical protein ABT189_43975, partial [Streptomyces sp900105755]|uniref:hypothetical protein n=1 Tax=Streptomyces sp. 900105755 TaxID=3154389 RepID=UPI0033265BA5